MGPPLIRMSRLVREKEGTVLNHNQRYKANWGYFSERERALEHLFKAEIADSLACAR